MAIDQLAVVNTEGDRWFSSPLLAWPSRPQNIWPCWEEKHHEKHGRFWDGLRWIQHRTIVEHLCRISRSVGLLPEWFQWCYERWRIFLVYPSCSSCSFPRAPRWFFSTIYFQYGGMLCCLDLQEHRLIVVQCRPSLLTCCFVNQVASRKLGSWPHCWVVWTKFLLLLLLFGSRVVILIGLWTIRYTSSLVSIDSECWSNWATSVQFWTSCDSGHACICDWYTYEYGWLVIWRDLRDLYMVWTHACGDKLINTVCKN